MSGIYIHDKELPESCGKCFVDMITDAFPACRAAKNYEEGKALIIEGFGSGERPANCPLVPVPDHGRENKKRYWYEDEAGCAICSECRKYAFETSTHHISGWFPPFCPNCGADMREVDDAR